MVEPEPPAKPGFTLKSELWTMFMLGWPMVISFVCRIAMASTDTAFVGHLNNQTVGAFFDRAYTGEEYLAAASLSDMVVNVLIVPPLAFNQVLNALVGQAIGAGHNMLAGPSLPLSASKLRSIAVLGPNSNLSMTIAGYYGPANACDVCRVRLKPLTSGRTK